ncbi:MAG: SRPBCC family protein [Bdellovibrionota bacterium]
MKPNPSPGSVTLHRVLKAPVDRVYRAFLDPDAMVKWLPPHGFTGHIYELDARVGGRYRMSFTNFSNEQKHYFGGTYLELKTNELIRYVDRFEDPSLPGEINVTISFSKVICGTELWINQEGIPSVIPTEMCYLGWQESLNALAVIVEPEIPGE